MKKKVAKAKKKILRYCAYCNWKGPREEVSAHLKAHLDKGEFVPKSLSLHECLVLAHGLVEKYIKTKDMTVLQQAHDALHQGF